MQHLTELSSDEMISKRTFVHWPLELGCLLQLGGVVNKARQNKIQPLPASSLPTRLMIEEELTDLWLRYFLGGGPHCLSFHTACMVQQQI